MSPWISALVDVDTFPGGALAHTLQAVIAVLVSLTPEGVVTTPRPGGAAPPAARVTWGTCEVTWE